MVVFPLGRCRLVSGSTSGTLTCEHWAYMNGVTLILYQCCVTYASWTLLFVEQCSYRSSVDVGTC